MFFEFLENDFVGDRVLTFAGVPTTTFTTTTLNALGTKYFALQNDFVLDSNIPFVTKALGGSLTPGQAEGIADTAIVFDASGSSTAQRAWGTRTIAVVFQGSTQTSVSGLAGGLALLDSGSRLFLEGGAFSTSRLSSTGAVNSFDGDVATVDDPLLNDFFGLTAPDYFVLDGTNVDSTDTFVSRGITPATGDVAGTAFFPNSIGLVVSGTAESTVRTRTTRRMFGYSGGAYQTSASGSSTVSSTTIFRNATSDPKDIVVKTSAETNKVKVDIDVIGFTLGSGSTTSSISGDILNADFGDLDTNTTFGDSSATSGNSVFVDNFTFGAGDRATQPSATFPSDAVTNADLTMVRVDEASEFSNGFLPSGVTVCSCTFLTWGFWSASIDRTSGNRERIHLANWVAGVVPTASDILALTGTASYSGHAIATVFNAGGVYQAIGNFTTTVDFGAETFTGDIDSFDGGNFDLSGGTISSSGGSILPGSSTASNLFSASIIADSVTPGTATGRSGSVIGSFMSGSGLGGDISSNMGGHFQIEDGSTYSASGIFALAK